MIEVLVNWIGFSNGKTTYEICTRVVGCRYGSISKTEDLI